MISPYCELPPYTLYGFYDPKLDPPPEAFLIGPLSIFIWIFKRVFSIELMYLKIAL